MRCGLPFPATVWRVATGWGEGTKRLRTAGAAGGDGKGPRAAEAVAVVRRSGRGEVTRGTSGRDETRESSFMVSSSQPTPVPSGRRRKTGASRVPRRRQSRTPPCFFPFFPARQILLDTLMILWF